MASFQSNRFIFSLPLEAGQYQMKQHEEQEICFFEYYKALQNISVYSAGTGFDMGTFIFVRLFPILSRQPVSWNRMRIPRYCLITELLWFSIYIYNHAGGLFKWKSFWWKEWRCSEVASSGLEAVMRLPHRPMNGSAKNSLIHAQSHVIAWDREYSLAAPRTCTIWTSLVPFVPYLLQWESLSSGQHSLIFDRSRVKISTLRPARVRGSVVGWGTKLQAWR
jgi:hypothetical protein